MDHNNTQDSSSSDSKQPLQQIDAQNQAVTSTLVVAAATPAVSQQQQQQQEFSSEVTAPPPSVYSAEPLYSPAETPTVATPLYSPPATLPHEALFSSNTTSAVVLTQATTGTVQPSIYPTTTYYPVEYSTTIRPEYRTYQTYPRTMPEDSRSPQYPTSYPSYHF